MSLFRLKVFAADHEFYDGECSCVQIPLDNGFYEIESMHENMICVVSSGIITLTTPDGKKERAFVSQGILKMEENECLMLVDTCERPEEINIRRAELDKEEADRKLREKISKREYFLAKASLARAVNRLKAAKKGQ